MIIMKRTITLLLTFCIMLTSISVVSVNAKKKVYSYNSKTKTLMINIQGKMKEYRYDEPWADVEYPENIVFKEGLTSISDYGFAFSVHGNGGERLNNYDRIKTVSLPSTVKSIGCYAFSDCKKLKKINIPRGVETIGDTAFESCENLQKITIPGSVNELPYGLFEYCKKLEKVKIKKGVSKID
jgi:hypothetical protein